MHEDTPEKQFVIQEHITPDGVHWDLMLEMDDCLWTWRLNTPPDKIKNEPLPAKRIHNHPKRFLTYEGKVQNNTGRVEIAERGTYTSAQQTENTLIINLQGKLIRGTYTFIVS